MRPVKRYFLIASLLWLMVLYEAAAESVKIGIPSLTVTMMPLAVARERGYFQQEGLNVDFVLMPAAMTIKVLLSGDIQYATTVGSAVVAAVRSIDVRVLMLFVDRPLLDLVASPEIHSIVELKGRVIGISSGRENKAQVLPLLKRFLKLEDEDLIAKIYDYHKSPETLDGKIDLALAEETIRDTRQTEGITREISVSQVFDFSYLEAAR